VSLEQLYKEQKREKSIPEGLLGVFGDVSIF
jgi:hypothetical protein